MKNKIAPLIIALLLLAGFTANLKAQTLDETVAYLEEKIRSFSDICITGSSSEGYYMFKHWYHFEKVTGKKIYFSDEAEETPKNKRSSRKESLERSDMQHYSVSTYSADLDKVNFSLNKNGESISLKMFSNMNEKSISIWNDPNKGDDYAEDPITSYTIKLIHRKEKECAGILKALKHLQKILGCENGAIDIQERAKNMFEE